MPKDPSPLLGYNNNIRHRNRVFHVQTEDSGVRHPHIITHLFMDGGRILKSIKTSYVEHVGAEKMQDVVRQMMKEQHKAMLIALRDGQYDALVDGDAAAAGGRNTLPKGATPDSKAKAPSAGATAAAPRGAKVSAPPPRSPEPTIPDGDAPPTTRTVPSAPEELTLDIEALERAAAESATPLFQAPSDLPPPPANLFRDRGTGVYRGVAPPSADQVRAPAGRSPSSRPGAIMRSSSKPPPPSRRGVATPAPPPRQTGKPPRRSAPPSSEGRYAPARPAAIFGQARPQRGNSIFGEDLISDKSLDEVILSYLAEDLEAPTGKKTKK
jgi:hypothetical protein